MKIALCFIISYEHIINKETIWREWIEPNKDLINVYFYYKDFQKIKSKWIAENALPLDAIYETSYFHVIPAYISILKYAMNHDVNNKWFCLLTDTCCPIISPTKFRYLFFNHYFQSFFSWKRAWWNPYFHKRANLSKLPIELWLANDPWFILTRENVKQVLYFVSSQIHLTQTICNGGLANESLFAIIFKLCGELDKKETTINCVSSHIVDWNRMTNSTSPHLFKEGNQEDIHFIEKSLERNECTCFIRKVSQEFPDEILKHYIYQYNKEKDNKLIIIKPREYNYTIIGFIIGVLCCVGYIIIMKLI